MKINCPKCGVMEVDPKDIARCVVGPDGKCDCVACPKCLAWAKKLPADPPQEIPHRGENLLYHEPGPLDPAAVRLGQPAKETKPAGDVFSPSSAPDHGAHHAAIVQTLDLLEICIRALHERQSHIYAGQGGISLTPPASLDPARTLIDQLKAELP